MSTSTIELKDVGPVKRLSLQIPEEGGVVVLRGRNGRGKTKTLEAIESAITGKGRLDVRDGALKGEVDAFGVSIRVGRATRRFGELEVTSLEGRLSVAELVDPGMKSDDAADARRIKALVQLANVLPSAELFWPLVGGRGPFEKVIGTNALAAEDLVSMADRIKRDFEKAARDEESQAEHAEGRARGAREAAAGVDVTAQDDPRPLQAELENAIRDESSLKAAAESSAKAKDAAERAKAQLEDAEAAYDGLSLEEAFAAEQKAEIAEQKALDKVRKLEAQLLAAKQDAKAAQSQLAHSVTVRKSAEQHQSMLSQWRTQLATSIPDPPTAEQLAAATERVTVARQAVETGAIVRKAKMHLIDADAHAAKATACRESAGQLREAAKGTDDVLSEVVAKTGSPLRVEAGRLVLETDRGATYFADLSMGERWSIALDIAVEAVGKRGVLTIPQEAFESLDPQNRKIIADHAVKSGVVILTAEASGDEDIVAEVFDGSEVAAV